MIQIPQFLYFFFIPTIVPFHPSALNRTDYLMWNGKMIRLPFSVKKNHLRYNLQESSGKNFWEKKSFLWSWEVLFTIVFLLKALSCIFQKTSICRSCSTKTWLMWTCTFKKTLKKTFQKKLFKNFFKNIHLLELLHKNLTYVDLNF